MPLFTIIFNFVRQMQNEIYLRQNNVQYYICDFIRENMNKQIILINGLKV
jgi:hypothetical protein